jgi:hypothetical protein
MRAEETREMRPQVHRAAHTPPAEFARNVHAGLRPQDLGRLEGKRNEREKQQRCAHIRADRGFAELSALDELGDKLVKPSEPLLIPPRLHHVDRLSVARRLRGDARPLSPEARALLSPAPQAGVRSAASNLAASADTRANVAAVEFLVVGPAPIGRADPGAA